MAKTKTVYICSNCGADSPKWIGKCPNCGEWNTYVEETVVKESPAARRGAAAFPPQPSPVLFCSVISQLKRKNGWT